MTGLGKAYSAKSNSSASGGHKTVCETEISVKLQKKKKKKEEGKVYVNTFSCFSELTRFQQNFLHKIASFEMQLFTQSVFLKRQTSFEKAMKGFILDWPPYSRLEMPRRWKWFFLSDNEKKKGTNNRPRKTRNCFAF